jgi:hypothetical protein
MLVSDGLYQYTISFQLNLDIGIDGKVIRIRNVYNATLITSRTAEERLQQIKLLASPSSAGPRENLDWMCFCVENPFLGLV